MWVAALFWDKEKSGAGFEERWCYIEFKPGKIDWRLMIPIQALRKCLQVKILYRSV